MAHARRSTNGATLAKMAQLAVAAPQVVAIRTSRMLAAGTNPVAADRVELSRMYTEKVQAYWESMFAMAAQTARANQQYIRLVAVQWWKMWAAPWAFVGRRSAAQAAASLLPIPTPAQSKRAAASLIAAAVAPVHKRATANARRLTRSGRR